MPRASTKRKSKPTVVESSDSDSEADVKDAKKIKLEVKQEVVDETESTSPVKGEKSAHRVDLDGKPGWELAPKRRVTLSEFRGVTYVDIREYYEKDGKMMPGKKGISLNRQQWEALVASADEITALLKTKSV